MVKYYIVNPTIFLTNLPHNSTRQTNHVYAIVDFNCLIAIAS